MIRIIGTFQRDNEVYLYYSYPKGGTNYFKIVTSNDGFQFNGLSKYVIVTDDKRREEKTYDWKNLRIAKIKDQYYMTYRVHAKKINDLNGAISTDLLRWTKTGKTGEVTEAGTVVPEFKYKNRYVMYFGEKDIKLAYSGDLKGWKTDDKVLLSPREDHFDNGEIEAGNAFDLEDDILLLYYARNKHGHSARFSVGAALFDKKDPAKLHWRSDKPLWETPHEFHHEKMAPLGSVVIHGELVLYWLVGESGVFAVSCPIPDKHTGIKDKTFSAILKKFHKNPIIAPNPNNKWESRATFNSAAVYEDGKVHFIYRALGDNDLSVLGYATSSDGVNIDERSDEPIYIPREAWETPGRQVFKTFADHFASGGGYGGVEDPRITKIDNKFYMTYVAFDGANPPRVALTSITVDDFLKRRWDKWETPKLISAPGMVNKNAVIFPEKINGKYVVFHRVYPNILVDFVDDLNFENESYLRGQYFIPPRKNHWDSKKIGAGAPPIRTKDGWLFIYQSVGYQDPGKYKIGAMMLDSNDPTKVLYRTNKPIVEPIESYENNGFKPGVVYPCGAVVLKDNLHVYYGGADSYTNVASHNLNEFLDEMKKTQEPKLRRVHAPILN